MLALATRSCDEILVDWTSNGDPPPELEFDSWPLEPLPVAFGFLVLELGCTVVAVGWLTTEVEKVDKGVGSRTNPPDDVLDAILLVIVCDEEVVCEAGAAIVIVPFAAVVVDVVLEAVFLGHRA